MASGNGGAPASSGLSSQAEVAARALMQLLARELSMTTTAVSGVESSAPVSAPVRLGSSTQPVPNNEDRVRQAMRRQFPSMYSTDHQPRGKRRFSAPTPCRLKTTDFHIYALPGPMESTPKGSDEMELAHAGLGKRMLTLTDNLTHSEIVAVLEEEFPKLKTLKGGWMFFKGSGGSGRRKLSIIPTDSEGYSTRLLKSASNNGKSVIFLVPLQEHLPTEPLPFSSAEFAKMPQSNCITCGNQMPLQLLPLHVKGCIGTLNESESGTPLVEDCYLIEQPVPPTTGMRESLEVCPICQESFPFDVLRSHASTCGDQMDNAFYRASPTREELPGPSVPRIRPSFSAAWANEVDPQKACRLFREELLDRHSECRQHFLSIDMFHEEEEQDSSLISFFKRNDVNWASPFMCRLRGDAAVGDGVNRHVFSMVMQKLKTGFSINLGSAARTSLFEGEKDHRVPSAAALLRESNLFEMAGRMIGQSFLHGAFGFSGLSWPVVTLLTGGSTETAVSSLTLLDCPDLDHRETIGFLKNAELTAEETTSVTDLCLSWDLPVPTSTNHDWLFQELLSHAVLKRVKQPIKQIRKGLKETGIWPLLSDRPDVHSIIFPRESHEELNPQAVIQNIHWSQPKCDSDEEEDDDPVPLDKVSLVTGFFRKFIEEASPEVLRDLMKFWVGWELLTRNLIVEVVTATYPVALTCFFKLKLPSHYQTYEKFHQDMMMAISSISSGFGLV